MIPGLRTDGTLEMRFETKNPRGARGVELVKKSYPANFALSTFCELTTLGNVTDKKSAVTTARLENFRVPRYYQPKVSTRAISLSLYSIMHVHT